MDSHPWKQSGPECHLTAHRHGVLRLLDCILHPAASQMPMHFPASGRLTYMRAEKKTIFVIEMQLKFVNVVVDIVVIVIIRTRLLRPSCVRWLLAVAAAFSWQKRRREHTSPAPWQIFNELHFLRVLGPSCKKKIVIFNYGPESEHVWSLEKGGRLCLPLALGFICCQKTVPWLIMRGRMFKLKTRPGMGYANIIKSLGKHTAHREETDTQVCPTI